MKPQVAFPCKNSTYHPFLFLYRHYHFYFVVILFEHAVERKGPELYTFTTTMALMRVRIGQKKGKLVMKEKNRVAGILVIYCLKTNCHLIKHAVCFQFLTSPMSRSRLSFLSAEILIIHRGQSTRDSIKLFQY